MLVGKLAKDKMNEKIVIEKFMRNFPCFIFQLLILGSVY